MATKKKALSRRYRCRNHLFLRNHFKSALSIVRFRGEATTPVLQ
jgi:hypothetical protein